MFRNSTGTPESHLVASYTLCELKNHLRPQRAALYAMDLINPAESQPTTPVNQRQPKYRPLLGEREANRNRSRFPPLSESQIFSTHFGQVLPSYRGTVQKLFDWVRCQCFGGSVPHSYGISAGVLTGVSAAVPLRHGHSQFQPQRSKAIVAFLSPTFHLGDGGKSYRSAQPGP